MAKENNIVIIAGYKAPYAFTGNRHQHPRRLYGRAALAPGNACRASQSGIVAAVRSHSNGRPSTVAHDLHLFYIL